MGGVAFSRLTHVSTLSQRVSIFPHFLDFNINLLGPWTFPKGRTKAVSHIAYGMKYTPDEVRLGAISKRKLDEVEVGDSEGWLRDTPQHGIRLQFPKEPLRVVAASSSPNGGFLFPGGPLSKST